MKIKSLNIKSFRHLQKVNFDFTYPDGHTNAGQPLNKICIIGQSATGKTSILELIKKSVFDLNEVEVVNGAFIFRHFNFGFEGKVEYSNNDESIILSYNSISKNGKEYKNMTESGGGALGRIMPDGVKLLYLSADIISKEAIRIFNQNPINILSDLQSEPNSQMNGNFTSATNIYEFGQEENSQLWLSLLHKVLEYRKKFTQMASELINKGAIGDLTKLTREFSRWSETNENPLVVFAEHFNSILNKLNLEVDLINTEYPIPIKSKQNDEVIPISNLSTGTKGLLFSMFALSELDTSESIILLDEPERSLFPDVQIELLNNYQQLAPDAQFIVATHSPFIAAAFEPEERFILFFDKEGKVAVRKGESPIGDDPNDILTNDFNVDYYNNFGKKAYKEYLELKRRVTLEREPKKKKELILELAELGDKYNF